ncbi:hypothetical protein [Sinorhizobium chiapasense]|uniref:Transmembrane protein n=1 Tax=Sinorhizobium chiapasense TaxID=501572 RepID=A0ABZ2BEX5_9HYPH
MSRRAKLAIGGGLVLAVAGPIAFKITGTLINIAIGAALMAMIIAAHKIGKRLGR